MNQERRRERRLYALLIVGVFAAVALWRLDLFIGAWRATAATFARGGGARWRLLGEIGLFSAILLATLRTIPSSVRPAHDAAVLLIAAAAGWAAEAWGTRLGLWHYYTGERPPLWIVPVWPLGAAMIERYSARARSWWGPAPEPLYWILSAAALGICLRFCGSSLEQPAVWAGPAAVFAALSLGAVAEEEFWTLAFGMAAVFFADFWGVTNGCWTYDMRGFGGPGRGIAFGMAFDAALILGSLRLARWIGA